VNATPATPGPAPARRSLCQRLFDPIPIAPIVYFRFLFGCIMVWEIGRYVAYGWVRRLYIEPVYHFKYFGFSWVKPWPGELMYLHFFVVGIAALGVTLGLAYRLSAAVFFLGFSYIFLLEEINYLNHLYLVCLLAFLSIFLPANRARALDARLRPERFATHVPAWTLLLLRFQIAIVYIYGAIAKLNPDWLRGEPIRTWLREQPRLEPLQAIFGTEGVVWIICYGGILVDLLVVPMLLWNRWSRAVAVVWLIVFHISNALMFRIGIFPWLMLGVTPLFFTTGWWARRNAEWILPFRPGPAGEPAGEPHIEARSRVPRGIVLGLLGAYAAYQVLMPLRHWVYPGDVAWTEEGHKFSWRMKLRSKRGEAYFVAYDPVSNRQWDVDVRPYVGDPRARRVATHPERILQLAHWIAADLRKEYPEVEIHAETMVSLNGRPMEPIVDPYVDLAREPWSWRPAKWIRPLNAPLPTSAPASRPVGDEEAIEVESEM
jgi:vitamin K-dependent gamma-carboxylase